MNIGRRTTPQQKREAPRAFALPVVLMVSLALATLITVLLDRFGSQTRSVSGIVRSYESYHAGRGLHQLFEAWLRTSNTSRLSSKLGENGLALTAQLSEGLTPNANSAETVKLYLADGQGSILAEPGGLPAEDVALAQAIINAARDIEVSNPDAAEGGIARRQFGPIAVSLRSASPGTLRAAVSGATAGDKVDEIVAQLLKAREDLNVASTVVSEIANKAGLAGDARANFLKVITVDPTMWNITAEVVADRLIGAGLLMRYKGTALVGASSNSATTARSIIRQWVREDVR
jgi:type II secretory pathway component PulK